MFIGSKLKPKIFFFSASKEVRSTQKSTFTEVRSLTSIVGHALILFYIGIHNSLCCSTISATCLPQQELSATAYWQDSNIKKEKYKRRYISSQSKLQEIWPCYAMYNPSTPSRWNSFVFRKRRKEICHASNRNLQM